MIFKKNIRKLINYMASLYRIKGRNTFYLSYRINNRTKIINTNIPVNKRSIAEQFKKEFEAKLYLLNKNNSTQKLPEPKTPDRNFTLNKAIENFIVMFTVTWSEGRFSNVQSVLKKFTECLTDKIEIKNITSQHLADYITQRKKIVTITTIRSDLQILRMFFNYLVEVGIINKSPLIKKLIPRPITNNITVMRDAELNRIFMKCRKEDKLFYKFLKLLNLTGARPGDILSLNLNSINFETGILRINISKTSRQIDFPMYEELRTFLQEEIFTTERNIGTSIFDEYKSHTITRKFSKLKRQLNLNKEYNLKTFRKTFATRLVNKGVDASIVAYLLGHTSVGTTAKYYIGKEAGNIKKILDRINK